MLILYCDWWLRHARKERRWIVIILALFGLLSVMSVALLLPVLSKPVVLRPNGNVKRIHNYMREV